MKTRDFDEDYRDTVDDSELRSKLQALRNRSAVLDENISLASDQSNVLD